MDCFDEAAAWYLNKIKRIPQDPGKLGCENCLTIEQLLDLFTGKYYIQEKFKGGLVARGTRGRSYAIYYDSDMNHNVDKIIVRRNNVKCFKDFTGRKVGTPNSVTYFASEFSTDTPSIKEIYEVLNNYLHEPALYDKNNKAGIVVKNYGTFGPGRYLFGEYLMDES
ncbi:hypothetical protein [Methanohalophilus mahii]|uniref:Uncharacterized protein n=1 Tax=Methanohalophilus mahii (strain ATCC 35705 / DSM 5219 / SLP) TaxID=547558 RepID=D5E9Z3_METMS|nr:hypothetical protein [Methanohalophilus mahii]ADE35994.1 hypothetical protein Mmah_0464 [Methanohalophilus mahii DSM 5219]